MSTTTAPAQREIPGSTHYPIGEASRYRRPPGHLDPDTSKTWLRRMLPVLRGHRAGFTAFIVLSFVSSVLQILAPNVINHATDALTTSIEGSGGHISSVRTYA